MLSVAFAVEECEKLGAFVESIISTHAQAVAASTSDLHDILTVALKCLAHYYQSQPSDAAKAAFVQDILNAIQAVPPVQPVTPPTTPVVS